MRRRRRRRRRGKPCREGESDKEDDLVQGDQCDTLMTLLGGNAVHDGNQWLESPQQGVPIEESQLAPLLPSLFKI